MYSTSGNPRDTRPRPVINNPAPAVAVKSIPAPTNAAVASQHFIPPCVSSISMLVNSFIAKHNFCHLLYFRLFGIGLQTGNNKSCLQYQIKNRAVQQYWIGVVFFVIISFFLITFCHTPGDLKPITLSPPPNQIPPKTFYIGYHSLKARNAYPSRLQYPPQSGKSCHITSL